MADAARATSAAPTFFDPARILKKILVDGGYGETNNPSHDAWVHYTVLEEILETDRTRWVNIGTGTSNDQPVQYKRGWKEVLLPSYIQNVMHTIRDLEKIATDSERTGKFMHEMSKMNKSKLDFYRFSATNGVHAIALDDYRTIDNKVLERLTKEYLDHPKVEEELRNLASSLAEDYAEKRGTKTVTLDMEGHLAPKASSIRQLITGQQPENLDLLSPGTGVPSMAGASEITAESSIANETPRSKNAVLEGPVPMVALQTDQTGVGDQFKTPEATATEFGPPTRSSTAPAKA
jgi:hypothetical protein